MIPPFDENGNLPPGIHEASWQEFAERFGSTLYRSRLLKGLWAALAALKIAGCKKVYIDGSFVTNEEVPSDWDGCWDINGVNPLLLDPVLRQFGNKQAAQKAKYFGEFFPAQMAERGAGKTFLEFFQVDKETGIAKGIVVLDLERL